MKKGLIIGMFLAAVSYLSVISAEDTKSKVESVRASQVDERFSLTNVTFFKRLENTYSSLNVNFELHNKTAQDIKLKVFLVAYRKVDSVDKNRRRWIEYPIWRKIDLDKENTKNILLDSVPVIDKNLVDTSLKDPNVYPDFEKYLQYLNTNSVGNDIVLRGLNAGPSENSGNPSMFIVTQSMKTSIFARLKVKFNPDNLFFNNFGIVIIDPEKKKVVVSDIFNFNGNFKSY